MGAVKALGPDQALVLRAPFEPIPLYRVLGKRGLVAWTECRGQGDWVVWFYRDPAVPAAASLANQSGTPGPGIAPPEPTTIQIDVRGLEPPRPMVSVLEALETLGRGERLEVLHDRRPMFLYPQLDERGFVHETEDVAPGMVRIRIWRGGGSR
jgi:uncharacterized protein (DUF2249 family)